MFPSRAIGHCPTTCLSRNLLLKPQWHAIRSKPLLTQRCVLPRLHTFRTQSAASIAAKRRLTYPENANVFNSGPVTTMVMGFTRVACVVVFGFGVLWAAPSALINPSTPWYWAPVWIAVSAVPLLATGFLFGGVVNHINVILPSAARRSKEDMMRFAARVPANTMVQIKSMWFRPWPHVHEVAFGDLRRLPQGRFGLGTNMEHQPLWNREQAESNPGWNWVAKRWMGRYLVIRGQLKDRSRVPGVWDKMWEQMPVAGEERKAESAEKAREETRIVREPAKTANRSNISASRAGRKAPPSPTKFNR